MPPRPSFDTWTIVFLFAAAQAVFVALALWLRPSRRPLANRLLAVLLLLFAISLVEYVLFWTRYIGQWTHMADLSLSFPLLFGPLLWLYCRIVFENRPLQRADWLHWLPFAMSVAAWLPWYALDAEAKRAVLSGKANFPIPILLVNALTVLRVAHMMAYAMLNLRYLRTQPRVGDTARWARWLNLFFLGFALAYASYFVLVRVPGFNRSWDYHISATMTLFIYFIAYMGFVQPAVFEGFKWTQPASPVKYRNSGLTPEAGRSLWQKLDGLMRSERLYRNPDLNLDALAQRLNMGKHHVSQVINEHWGASFFEYVNHLRIQEAQQLLADTPRSALHVIEVAYAVGFNNKVSFNNAFKKATGMTPTEYRNNGEWRMEN
jgi:AraC-like DNA-binding protein